MLTSNSGNHNHTWKNESGCVKALTGLLWTVGFWAVIFFCISTHFSIWKKERKKEYLVTDPPHPVNGRMGPEHLHV